MKNLVIVESPTKARTIRKFLPSSEYRVEACMGHVRDLPASASEIPKKYKSGKKTPHWVQLGVNVEEEFEPLYVVPSDKKKVITELKSALKDADRLYIATDEDREGESIGWHLLEVLKPKVPVQRMVFHEITKTAILDALNKTREVDKRLVDAQETRRVLDRLVGYEISPLLWRKIAPKLSAGRVQSAAVRLLVQREWERIEFVSAGYWDLKARLAKGRPAFDAQMTHYAGTRLATGRDFDEKTGKLKKKEVLLLDEDRARQLVDQLKTEPWRVTKVEEKSQKRRPYPPFITSTLQQEANRKLGLSAKDTMRTAQRLYEQGLITYMRTDSTNLSNEAIEAARKKVERDYGTEFLSPKPRRFSSSSKNAQEAHEAIRPSGTEMLTADEQGLTGRERSLYDLIWKRTVASQMADARLQFTTATIEAGSKPEETGTFRASGKRIEFAGFFRAYVEGSDDPGAALEDQENVLPALQAGDDLTCKKLEAIGHETKPPARYTEASLVKELERLGIGRPSTYASIIGTIVARAYARRNGKQLVPSFTAFAVNQLLEQQFDKMVDFDFTARMEQTLDEIADGKIDAIPYLKGFYYADDDGLKERVEEGIEEIDPRKVSTITTKKWDPYVVRVGKFGPYVEGKVNEDIVTASLPNEIAPDELTVTKIKELLAAKEADDLVLGIHPEHEQPVLLREGPYGWYVQLGDDEQAGKPKRASVPKGMVPEQVDLDLAVDLLSLPRLVGNHPETGEPILSNFGRYGPYVQLGRTYASLTDDDNVLTVGLERALELISKKTRKNAPLKTLGNHPETGEPIALYEGRYGPYVKHLKTNASLPKGADMDAFTLDQAVDLIAKKEAAPKKRRRRRK